MIHKFTDKPPFNSSTIVDNLVTECCILLDSDFETFSVMTDDRLQAFLFDRLITLMRCLSCYEVLYHPHKINYVVCVFLIESGSGSEYPIEPPKYLCKQIK